MVRELVADEFDERFTPIFEHVLARANYPYPFSPQTFFPRWRASMEQGVARTWASESNRSVLGALFTRNIFTDQPGAFAIFWFTRGGDGRSPLELNRVFEEAARAAQCRFAYSSAFDELDGGKMERLYRMKGFSLSETVFRKKL